MEKKAQIKIKGIQVNGRTDDMVELVTEGKYKKDKNGYTLSYEESQVTGMEGTLTTISANCDSVTIVRQGTVNNQFEFVKGKLMKSYYETPYGAFLMSVTTKLMEVELNDEGGSLKVVYNLDINGVGTGRNNLSLSVKTL